jgi:hypothetical protein
MPRIPDPVGAERLALVGLAVVALIVAAMAVPRLVAGTMFALAPGVREDSSYPRPQEAAPTLAWLERSQAWSRWGDAGLYQALTRQVAGLDGERADLEGLLEASPLRPEQWYRLGRIVLAADDPERALAAWRMSVYSARIHPPVMEERLELGLALKDRMAPADLALLDDQVRQSFVVRPAHVVRMMGRPDNAVHQTYFQAMVSSLSITDIDHMVRIHARH